MALFGTNTSSSLKEDVLLEALNSVSDGVIICDNKGVVRYSNRIAETQYDINSGRPLNEQLEFSLQINSEPYPLQFSQLLERQSLDELEEKCYLSVSRGLSVPFRISISTIGHDSASSQSFLYVFTITDESRTNELQQSLNFHRKHDQLTGLANRNEFENVLMEALHDIKLNHSCHSLCLIKIRQMKLINEATGYLAGNELIKAFSCRLKESTRRNDFLARVGNDEFGLVLWDVDTSLAEKIISKLLRQLSDFHFDWNDKDYLVGAVVGITKVDSNLDSWAEVVQQADIACSQAMQGGNYQYCVYEPSTVDIKSHQQEAQWVSKLVKAVRNDLLEFYQQPIVSLGNRPHLNHCELLLRVQEGNGQTSSPGAFLLAAEKYNMINMIDRWVVLNSFRWLAENRNLSLDHININLSGISITKPEFLRYIDELMSAYLVPANKVCFEITETAAVENINTARDFIVTIKEFGCRIALDDFGTGMASFSYLKNLPVDYVKIDGEFVREILQDRISESMVRAINDVAHEMGALTIAEYVENDAIKDRLLSLGIDFAQGYGIGKPQPIISLVENTMTYPYSSQQ